MYTIASGIEKKGLFAATNFKGVSWSDYDSRNDMTGWLGDAVGKNTIGINPFKNKSTSFGPDDIMADLDSENVINNLIKHDVKKLIK